MLRACALRLCVVWLLGSVLCFAWSAPILDGLAPVIGAAVRVIAPALDATVRYVEDDAVPQLLLDATAADAIVLAPGLTVPAGQPLPARASGVHVLVPLVLLASALGALPARHARERLWLSLSALPFGLLTVLVTAPFQLVGLVEVAFQDFALSRGLERAAPVSLRWMLFLEGGGRWLVPLALAALAYALVLQTGRVRRAG